MCCILLLIKRRRMVRGGLLQEDGASHRYTHIQTDSNCNITYYYCILPRWWRQFYFDNKVLEMESLFIEYFFYSFQPWQATLTRISTRPTMKTTTMLSAYIYRNTSMRRSWRIPPWCTERLTAAKVDILHYIHTYIHTCIHMMEDLCYRGQYDTL